MEPSADMETTNKESETEDGRPTLVLTTQIKERLGQWQSTQQRHK